MKLVILDPGLAHSHAHHQTVDLAIHKSWHTKNASVVVIAAKSLDIDTSKATLDAGMRVIPYFDTPCYPKKANNLPKWQHKILIELFAKEIINLYRSGLLKGDEHLLFHTGYSFHIAGLARAIWHLKDQIMQSRLLISMMFHPGVQIDIDKKNFIILDELEYIRYKLALKLLQASCAQAGISVILATSCRAYQKVYQPLWPSNSVVIHPAVGYQPLQTETLVKTLRPRVLLYLGGAKADKGIIFSAEFGIAAAQSFPNIEFIFHFNQDFPGALAFSPKVDELRKAGERHDNVRIYTGNLGVAEYDKLIATSQIICILYDPAEYRFKTSGVFWDALRNESIDWLVTQETWPDLELTELGISHAAVPYRDAASAVKQLAGLIEKSKNPQSIFEKRNINTSYRKLINSSFGDWLYQQFSSQQLNRIKCASFKNLGFSQDRGRILVVRTKYGHFSPFSGPGGFIPHLRGLGYHVDELQVCLGNEKLDKAPQSVRDQFIALTQSYLRSYQGNAVLTETEVQRQMYRYDIVHFLDAEHSGLLSALFKLKYPKFSSARLIATYHQPQSIMREIIANYSFLKGFDRIHLMSPCQAGFFEPIVENERITIVPHGLAPELLGQVLPAWLVGANIESGIDQFDPVIQSRKILLTVGSWLRDFDQLLATAKYMQANPDIVFVVVSKGLYLEGVINLSNIVLINQGLNDSQLHALYLRSTLLFLPLKDGAANNAILEAMAHGLPIVTTDLPSTRFYTKNQAEFAEESKADAYARALKSMLNRIEHGNEREKIGRNLRNRAKELIWKNVALNIHEDLYYPEIQLSNRCE